MNFNQEEFNELAFYTLSHPDQVYFIHQHFVDAHMAQYADESTKPIGIAFALAGLYLLLEKNYTGRQVQRAHMQLAKHKKAWPTFILPEQRGEITITTVLLAPAGVARDTMIKNWCRAVWEAYADNHERVAQWLKTEQV